MKIASLISAAAAATLLLPAAAFCAHTPTPSPKALTVALEKYLAKRGDLCLAKYDWPIEVTAQDTEMQTKDALQMPVLEKLGLVASSSATTTRKTEDGADMEVPVTRYALTEAGRKFYINRKTVMVSPSGERIIHNGDLCAGRLSLDKVVKWDKPAQASEGADGTLYYTYHFAPAEWVRDPEAQKVFPMLARLIQGDGSFQLEQHFRLSGGTWIAVNPWQH